MLLSDDKNIYQTTKQSQACISSTKIDLVLELVLSSLYVRIQNVAGDL